MANVVKSDFHIGDFINSIQKKAAEPELEDFEVGKESAPFPEPETEPEIDLTPQFDIPSYQNEGEDQSFFDLCQVVQSHIYEKWDKSENRDGVLDLQKNAMIGHEKDVIQMKTEIRDFLKSTGKYNSAYPSYYQFSSLESAIFDELFGYAGFSEWFSPKYASSSSAKMVGDRIYFLENGKMVLKEQKINKIRRDQLIRALLLSTPGERIDKDFHEVYTSTHDRVTIFTGDMVKDQEDVLIFRRYTIPSYTFDEQIKRHTIPQDSKPLLIDMVKLGFNIIFSGAVRTAKTTFLSTWLMYEDPTLEGVLVETDPEIPVKSMLPTAPIIQLIADGEELKHISKNLLRSDADMLIMGEARDGIALDIAVRIANKGTRRVKFTFHTRDPIDICYDIASEITKMMGGDTKDMAKKVAKSFDYVFHFVQLQDKSQKRLNAIYEISYDYPTDVISVKEICRYNYKSDSWGFNYVLSEDKRRAGIDENEDVFYDFEKCLKSLAEKCPLDNPGVYNHRY